MSENIDLVRALYPEGDLDWVAVLGSRASEDAYLNQVRPLLHPEFEVA